MAESTRSDKGQKRNAQPILIDAASLDAIVAKGKNKQLAFMVHPKLWVDLLTTTAEKSPTSVLVTPAVTSETGAVVTPATVELKRTGLVNYVRKVVADALGYTGDTIVPSIRTGPVVSTNTLFNSVVADMFAMSRSYVTAGIVSEEQGKSMAFAQALQSVAANPALAGIPINEDVLEAIWSGPGVTIEEEEDDEPDDDDDDA